jgi:signal transduction histidine kinase
MYSFTLDKIKRIEANDSLAEYDPLDFVTSYLNGLAADFVVVNSENIADVVAYYFKLTDELDRNISMLLANFNFDSLEAAKRWTHDVRGALTRIKGYLDMLGTQNLPSDRLFGLYQKSKHIYDAYISEAQNTLSNLEGYDPTDRVLDLGYFCKLLESFKFSAYQPVSAAHDVKISVNLSSYLQGRSVVVSSIPKLILQQNVFELIINATKYGASNIKVTIAYMRESLVVRVSDDGNGFQEDRLAATLKALETKDDTTLGAHENRTDSTGKGLVAMAHAGFQINIIPHSGENQGSTIIATLPIDQQATDNFYSSKEA